MNSQIEKLLAIQESLKGRSEKPAALIIDDDHFDCDFMRKKLEDYGIRAEVAWTGEEALRRLEHETFWVIFLDWKLQGISGFDTLRKIRLMEPSPVVVVITGWCTDDIANLAFSAGSAAVMSKPLEDKHVKLIFGKP